MNEVQTRNDDRDTARDWATLTEWQQDRLPKLQRAGVRQLRHILESRLLPDHEIRKFEVQQGVYGHIMVSIDVRCKEAVAHPDSLRAILCRETWLVKVGLRGRLEAVMYPDSIRQFAGEDWCGIHIDPSGDYQGAGRKAYLSRKRAAIKAARAAGEASPTEYATFSKYYAS